MTHLILLAVFILLGAVMHSMNRVGRFTIPSWTAWIPWVVALFLIGSTSFVIVDQDKIGHLKRIYFSDDMAPGQIIAFDGQTGEATTFGRIYRGYNISALGSVIGLAWAFFDGLIGGAIFAWLYNLLAGPKAAKSPAE